MKMNIRKKKGFSEIDPISSPDEDEVFKSILETYKSFVMALSLTMMYPNPHNERKRLVGLAILLATFIPAYIMWFYDVSICLRNADLDNLTRQLTIGVPILFCNFKMFYITIKRESSNNIFKEIDSDYMRFNHLDEIYKKIVRDNRESMLNLERIWTSCCIIGSGIFPAVAGLSMVAYHLKDIDKKVMLHELRIPVFDEYKYKSPYFEILFVYMFFVTFILAISFLGYDGMFFVCMRHICLKLRLTSCKLEHAFDDPKDVCGAKKKIGEVINEQCDTFRFVTKIQETYELWLMLVFILTVIQICVDMYQIINDNGKDMDPRYVVFIVAAILHIYVPCWLAANVASTAEEVALSAYFSGWEQVRDVGLRRSIAFIIARAQIPLWIKPMNLIIFNMQLFVCVLQKSYSVFTLLRSRK